MRVRQLVRVITLTGSPRDGGSGIRIPSWRGASLSTDPASPTRPLPPEPPRPPPWPRPWPPLPSPPSPLPLRGLASPDCTDLAGLRQRSRRPASAVRGLVGDEQHDRCLVDQAVPLGRLEAGVVEPAEVGRQRVDPAAGRAQQQTELVQRDPARR